MAKRLNLQKRLGQNDYGTLFQLAGWQGLPKEQTEKELAYIEETGKLPDSLISRVKPNVARDLKDLIQSKLPTALQQVGEKFNEAGAGLGDVEQRLEAFRQAGEEPVKPLPPTFPNVSALKVSGILKSHTGLSDELNQQLTNQFMQTLLSGNLKSVDQVKTWISNALGLHGRESAAVLNIGNLFNPQDFISKTTTPTDYSAETARLTDLRNAIQKRDISRADVIDFLRSAPEELSQARTKFVAGERAKAQSALREQVIPDIAQSLNVRGGLYSGELGSQISEAQLSSQSQIENLEFALQTKDENFFADAAYQQKLQDEINAGKDVREQIQAGRVEQRLGQQQRFESAQNEINRQFNLGLQRRQAERQFSLNQQQREFQKQQIKRQNEAELIRGLVSAGTQVATTAIVPKVPSTI